MIVKLNCLLAYCLLVKNVCCLELIKTPYTFGLSLLCSVFKGLLELKQLLKHRFKSFNDCRSNFYTISECQLLVNSFLKVFFASFSKSRFSNSLIITYRLLFVKNFFEFFLDKIKLLHRFFFNDFVILSCDLSHVKNFFKLLFNLFRNYDS
jgi:hypothetical protein